MFKRDIKTRSTLRGADRALAIHKHTVQMHVEIAQPVFTSGNIPSYRPVQRWRNTEAFAPITTKKH